MLTGRVIRNIVFWVLVIVFIYTLNSNADAYPQSVYLTYKAITTFLLIVLTYINNLLLMPYLWARKKYWQHILVVIGVLLFFGTCYVLLMKDMIITYPDMKVYEVSIITSPVHTDYSFLSIFEDVITYAFGLFLWVGTFTMAWYMNDYERQKRIAKEALLSQRETELSLLRNQVNPHFLFNTLNNIYGLTLQKSDKAPDSVLQLSSIMRYMLYDANTTLMPYEKEREVMQAYIDMELLRLPKNDQFSFSINADKNYNLPPLLWLPILENVFKHGTRVIADEYFINYSFSIVGSMLTISAENNYKEVEKSVGGVGLNNLRKRLEIIYPKKHSIEEQKDNGKYSIKLSVKLD